MTAVTFSGLSSGIDTAALVTKLVASERRPAEVIAGRQSDLSTQRSILGSLSSALAALGTVARGMDLSNELQPRTAASSDAHVTVAASSGATATVHDVRVTQLARGQITSSRTFASAAAGVLGAGTLSIQAGGTTKSISYGATDSLAEIATKINGAGGGATASVLFDGTSYRLMVASTATGTAATPAFTDGGDGLGLSNPANVKIAAQDAIAQIDGVAVTRGTNVFEDAIPGVTLTLVSQHAATDASSQARVSLDSKGVGDKLKAMVSAYNAVNSALHVQLDYTGVKKGTSTLFGDATLRQLQGALGTMMSSAYNTSTLGGVGIVRGKDGAVTIDETKLSAALAADPDAVSKLFVTGGFATAVTKLTDAYSRAGDGILALKSKSLSERSTALQSQADRINNHADALKTQLEAQFTALETAMTKLKGQSAYLTSIFG